MEHETKASRYRKRESGGWIRLVKGFPSKALFTYNTKVNRNVTSAFSSFLVQVVNFKFHYVQALNNTKHKLQATNFKCKYRD